VGTLLLLWFLWNIRDIVLLFIIAVIISSALDPMADFLQKRKVPRSISVLFVYLIVIGIITAVGFLIVPPLTAEFNTIKNGDFYQTFTEKIGGYSEALSHSTIGQSIDNSFKELVNNLGGTIFETTKSVLTGLVSLITVFVISFYLTVDESGMKNFVKHLVPYKHEAYASNLINRIQRKMGAWVLAQLILSAVIFGLVFLGLSLLHVQFALVLAIIAGVFEVVPFIGPFVSGAIAVFFAFLQAPALAVAVIILWIVTQQLESHVVVPIVMSRSVGLNPVLVILAILIGATLDGILGALIAVPVVSGLSVFITDLLNSNESGEPIG